MRSNRIIFLIIKNLNYYNDHRLNLNDSFSAIFYLTIFCTDTKNDSSIHLEKKSHQPCWLYSHPLQILSHSLLDMSHDGPYLFLWTYFLSWKTMPCYLKISQWLLLVLESSYKNASISIYLGSINPYTTISHNGPFHDPNSLTNSPTSWLCTLMLPFSIALIRLFAAKCSSCDHSIVTSLATFL